MPPELNTVRVSYLPMVTIGAGDYGDCDAAGAVRNSATRGVAVSRDEPGICLGVLAAGDVDDD